MPKRKPTNPKRLYKSKGRDIQPPIRELPHVGPLDNPDEDFDEDDDQADTGAEFGAHRKSPERG